MSRVAQPTVHASVQTFSESTLMLGIGALGATSAVYYLDSVAFGREDDYVGPGEAPGVWLGEHARTLGLEGTVAAPHLHAVLEGLDPSSGIRLDRARANRAPGCRQPRRLLGPSL